MKKILLIIIPVLMLSCASSHQNESDLDEPQSHELLTIAARDFEINTEYAATIKGLQDISVIPRIEGYLQDIYVKEGDRVKAGQLLFRIDDAVWRADERCLGKGTVGV